jgi:hypothetical protein
MRCHQFFELIVFVCIQLYKDGRVFLFTKFVLDEFVGQLLFLNFVLEKFLVKYGVLGLDAVLIA